MLKIGLIGADSFHALAFAKLANLSVDDGGSGFLVSVKAIWGENAERTKFVAEQSNIPLIVNNPAEMIDIVDAVMIVTRDGSTHLNEATPFIDRSIPVWIDKPFTFTVKDASSIIHLAMERNTFLAGGSFCKYCPDVLHIRDEIIRLGDNDNLISAHFNFPAQVDDPYGGLHFYAPHTAEILATMFGNDIRSIKADKTNNNIIGIFKYDKLAVSVNFAQVSDFSCTLYSKSEVKTYGINISSIYRYGFAKFVNGIIANTPPEHLSTLIWPVKIVNALIDAVESNKEILLE